MGACCSRRAMAPPVKKTKDSAPKAASKAKAKPKAKSKAAAKSTPASSNKNAASTRQPSAPSVPVVHNLPRASSTESLTAPSSDGEGDSLQPVGKRRQLSRWSTTDAVDQVVRKKLPTVDHIQLRTLQGRTTTRTPYQFIGDALRTLRGSGKLNSEFWRDFHAEYTFDRALFNDLASDDDSKALLVPHRSDQHVLGECSALCVEEVSACLSMCGMASSLRLVCLRCPLGVVIVQSAWLCPSRVPRRQRLASFATLCSRLCAGSRATTQLRGSYALWKTGWSTPTICP